MRWREFVTLIGGAERDGTRVAVHGQNRSANNPTMALDVIGFALIPSRNRATAAASERLCVGGRPYRTFDYAIRLHGKEVREALVCRFVRIV
jgi:hypothetical protein